MSSFVQSDSIKFNVALEKVIIMEIEGKEQMTKALFSSSGSTYEMVKKLQGSKFGYVYLANALIQKDGKYYRTNKQVAVKRCNKICMSKSTCENSQNEIFVSCHLGQDCKEILTYSDCCEDNDTLFLVSHYCNGGDMMEELLNNRAKNGFYQLDISQVVRCISDVSRGIAHMHSKGIAHHDISLENVLYDNNTKKHMIIDFGMALSMNRKVTDPTCFEQVVQQVVCGKQAYMAPEIQFNHSHIDASKCDLWALGVTLFLLLIGRSPFNYPLQKDKIFHHYLSNQQNINSILFGKELIGQSEHFWSGINLVNQLLMVNADKRPSIDAVLSHPFLLHHADSSHTAISMATVLLFDESVPDMEECETGMCA